MEHIMKRFLVSAVIVAGLVLVGCEKKEDSSKDVNQAANKTANQAADSLNKAKSNVNEGADKAKDAAKDAANQATDAAKSNMDAVQKQIDDLINKAKDAVKDKKWSDAENYIAQIKTMEANLPQAAQDKINANLADVQKMIDAGKQMTPGK
jgi:flagellum-specific peptidoglycan hydrolase FlgJ